MSKIIRLSENPKEKLNRVIEKQSNDAAYIGEQLSDKYKKGFYNGWHEAIKWMMSINDINPSDVFQQK